MGAWQRWGLVSAAVLAVGCSGAVTVRGEVLRPARIPVRTFPRILVVAASSAEAAQVADAVADHLEGGRSEVRRAREREVTALREAGRIERATGVVRVAVELDRRDRPQWNRRDDLSCGPWGCMQSQRPIVQDVPVVSGLLVITVSDGPSGRVLQREELTDEESGADELGMRLRVVERLTRQALLLVDQRSEPVVVELHPIEATPVRDALERIRAGRWREGRARLERFVRSRAFEALPRDRRALVLYDLGQSRRFDTSEDAEARFVAAAEALRAAVRLVPAPRYANALADLEAQRSSRAMVREQDAAMAHNFALARHAAPAVPAPPPGYRTAE